MKFKFSKVFAGLWLTSLALPYSCTNDKGLNSKAKNGGTIESGTAHHHQHKAASPKDKSYIEAVNSGKIEIDTMKGSPLFVEMRFIGKAHVTITYSSPGVKGRVIWGGLVPYSQLWVSGAHHATKLSFSKEVIIKGKKIPAGEYALFTIPGPDQWTIILNKKADQHLTDDYSEKDDVLRFQVVPVIQAKMVQRLTYSLEKTSFIDGIINLEWEKIKISIPVRGL